MGKKDTGLGEASRRTVAAQRPHDIQQKEFRVSRFGGYKMRDVDEFLDQITDSFTALTSDVDRLAGGRRLARRRLAGPRRRRPSGRRDHREGSSRGRPHHRGGSHDGGERRRPTRPRTGRRTRPPSTPSSLGNASSSSRSPDSCRSMPRRSRAWRSPHGRVPRRRQRLPPVQDRRGRPSRRGPVRRVRPPWRRWLPHPRRLLPPRPLPLRRLMRPRRRRSPLACRRATTPSASRSRPRPAPHVVTPSPKVIARSASSSGARTDRPPGDDRRYGRDVAGRYLVALGFGALCLVTLGRGHGDRARCDARRALDRRRFDRARGPRRRHAQARAGEA